MANNILLSFIVPFHNVEKYIKECILSLYYQDIPKENYEVIAINDCSIDHSRDILVSLQKEYPTLKLIDHLTNKRQGSARNTGLFAAKGEYIWFVDADDFLEPNVLQELINIAIENNLEILHFDYIRVIKNKKIQKYQVNCSTDVVDGNTFFFDKGEIWWKKNVEVWRRIHKRSFLLINGLIFEETSPVFEDIPFSIQVFNKAKRVMHISITPYCYRFNPDSYLNSNITSQKLFDIAISSINFLFLCKNSDLHEKYAIALNEVTIFHYNEVIKALPSLDKQELSRFLNKIKELDIIYTKGFLKWDNHLLTQNQLNSEQPLKLIVEIVVHVSKEIFLKDRKRKNFKENYLKTLIWGISCFTTNHLRDRKLLSYIFDHFYYSHSIKRFFKNLKIFILSFINSVKTSKNDHQQISTHPEIVKIDTKNDRSNKTPLVSVFIVTYNHEEYIAHALESALMQKTSFDFEIVVGEDCSSDSTRSIIREYESKYPDIIRAFYQEKNVGREKNIYEFTLPKCRGKYIAYLEGDDYWTDPFKLQKQIGFLEANPDYTVCFHRCKILDQEENTFRNDGCGFLFQDKKILGIDIDTEMFLNHWITQSLTMIYRRESFNFSVLLNYKHFRDMHHIYYLLQNGKGYVFAFEGGVYREHLGGLHSKRSLKYQSEIGIAVAKELYFENRRNKLLKNNFIRTLQWGIFCFSTNHYGNLKLLTYIFSHLYYSGSIKRFLKNLFVFFKYANLSFKKN